MDGNISTDCSEFKPTQFTHIYSRKSKIKPGPLGKIPALVLVNVRLLALCIAAYIWNLFLDTVSLPWVRMTKVA